MGFFARSLASFAPLAALSLGLVLTPAAASAQGAATATPTPPPPGGDAPSAGASTGTGGPAGPAGSAAPAADAKSTGNVGGVSFEDKPARRAPVGRVVRRTSGPLATFPGFEQLPDGGSRLFVQLNQAVPVEERRAQGSVTYVLRGAHLRVHNDSNALVTVHFNTPVYRAKLTPQGNDLLFILELRSAATPTFKVAENPDKTSTLQIDFAKGDFIPGDGTETVPRNTKPVPSIGRRGKGRGQPAPAAPAGDPNDGPTP